jgi:hypothetical protein
MVMGLIAGLDNPHTLNPEEFYQIFTEAAGVRSDASQQRRIHLKARNEHNVR